MAHVVQSWRGWSLSLALVLGVASLAFAQLAGTGAAPTPIMEYTQQEVQAAQIVETLNDLGKQRWEIFQIVPSWTVGNLNGAAELTAKSYQIFGRRAVAAAK